jgi:hypothetical protein
MILLGGACRLPRARKIRAERLSLERRAWGISCEALTVSILVTGSTKRIGR